MSDRVDFTVFLFAPLEKCEGLLNFSQSGMVVIETIYFWILFQNILHYRINASDSRPMMSQWWCNDFTIQTYVNITFKCLMSVNTFTIALSILAIKWNTLLQYLHMFSWRSLIKLFIFSLFNGNGLVYSYSNTNNN